MTRNFIVRNEDGIVYVISNPKLFFLRPFCQSSVLALAIMTWIAIRHMKELRKDHWY